MIGMWRDFSTPGNWSAGAIWGAYRIHPKEGDIHLIDVEPEVRLSINLRKWLAAAPPPERIVLQAVTLGRKAIRLIKRKRGAAEKLLWHGLAAEATEALAEWCSRKAASGMGWREWRRVSPGFPAWPELKEQRKLFSLLRPGRIGIRLKRRLMMEPEYSTTAALFPR